MSFSIKQFATGIGLKPVSADPSNPTQGQLQYADGTVRAEGLWRYDGTAWQQVGSGAGSYDIFFQENLETNTSSNFISGQNASPDAAGTGTLDGTLADEESSQISGDRSLKYTMGASSDNDFFLNDTDIALAVKQQGQFIGITFYYTYNGNDDDIRFFVLDQDDNELTQSDEYIKSASTATRFSTSVFVPSSDTALRYGFQVVTGNSSKVFIVDDIEFSTNPFVYKNLTETNSVELNGTDGRAITASTESISWNGSGNGWVSGANGSNFTNGNYYEVQKNNSIVEIDGSIAFTANSNNYIGLYLNGAFYKIVSAFNTTTRKKFQFTSIKGEFSAGDKISFGSNAAGFTSNTSATLSYLRINEQWEAEHVVTPAKVVDEYYRARAVASGSTNTAIPYWSSDIVDQTGDLISIASSATDGMSITALKDVVITASYSIRSGTNGGQNLGWSLNSNQLSTNILSITSTDRLKYTGNTSTPSESYTHDCSVQIKLSAGDVLRPHTNGTITSADASNSFVNVLARAANAEFLAAVPVQKTAVLKDVKTDGVNGGTFTGGSWVTRTLNTLENPSNMPISLSSNQFTLPKGTYEVDGLCPAFEVNFHICKLYNVTDASDELIGLSSRSWSSGSTQTTSIIKGVIQITESKTFELQHICENTKTLNGLGTAVSVTSADEVYSQLTIRQIK